MKAGIIGFARSGKTTVYNALTGAHAAVGAFGSREANLAVLKVPDERVDALTEVFKPKKKTYAEFQFVDIAPNEASGAKRAIDSAALTVLKNVDALVHVVRCFSNEEVIHPLGDVDPPRTCIAMEEELILSDLAIVEKRVARLERENKDAPELHVLKRCQSTLEAGEALRDLHFNPQEAILIGGYGFLSLKPLLLVGNYGEEAVGTESPSGMGAFAKERGFTLVELCGALELEVAELAEDERAAFREDLGLGEESKTRFLLSAYDMLGLMSFLTAGDPEVRAWTIRKGTRAVDAAAVIHSDIQRGFIRAEAVGYDDFMAAGSMAKAKEQGHFRLEGKEYIVKDGDILLFRFNV